MEAGNLEVALAGLRGVRQRVGRRTRVYLEASALLAICHLRRNEISEAEPLMAEVLRNDHVITSERRRRAFRVRIIQRFEEEAVIAALRGHGRERLDIDAVQDDAGRAVQTQTEEEILDDIGRIVPPEAINVLLHIHEFAKRQLPASEARMLPPPRTVAERVSLGRTIMSAAKRVAWRSVCDPESEVYKMWFTHGMMAVLDRKLMAIAIAAALSGMRIGAYALAVSVTAVILKMGLEVFCELSRPEGIMSQR